MDALTFFLAFLIAAAALADFLLGEAGRRRIQSRIVEWWIRLAESKYFGVTKRELEAVSNLLHRVFGQNRRTARFYLATSVISIVATTVVLGTAFEWLAGHEGPGRYSQIYYGPLRSWGGVFLSAITLEDLETGIYLGNWLGDLLSVGVTLVLLERMVRSHVPSQLMRYLAIDVLVALVLLHFVLWMASAFDEITADEPVLTSLAGGFFGGFSLLIEALRGEREAIAISAPAVTALFPTLFHMSLLASVLLTKWATPVIRPPVLLVLQRLSEAKKGVLTLVVGAIAIVGKLTQLAIAAFA